MASSYGRFVWCASGHACAHARVYCSARGICHLLHKTFVFKVLCTETLAPAGQLVCCAVVWICGWDRKTTDTYIMLVGKDLKSGWFEVTKAVMDNNVNNVVCGDIHRIEVTSNRISRCVYLLMARNCEILSCRWDRLPKEEIFHFLHFQDISQPSESCGSVT